MPYSYTFYINATSLICRYPKNQHKGSLIDDLRIDFDRNICISDFDTNEKVDDYVLPPNILKLVEQKKKHNLPHEKLTEIINLGSKNERKEIKVGTSISSSTK